MAELVLHLRVDPATGRRELVIDYASDADALPMEHEEEHRRLAGLLVADGLGSPQVAVSRAAEDATTEAVASAEAALTPIATR